MNTNEIRGNIAAACQRLRGKLKPGEERADLAYIQGYACTALNEIDRLENGALNLRENVDLLRREKQCFIDRVQELEEELRNEKIRNLEL